MMMFPLYHITIYSNILGGLKQLLRLIKVLTKLLLPFTVISTLIILLNRILLSLSYYPELGGIEPTFIYFIQKVSLQIPFIGNPELPPYTISQYSPAYFFLVNKLCVIAGINPLIDIHGIYVFCRLFNLWLNIFSACLLYFFLTRKLKSSKSIAAIFSMISFCLYQVHHFAARPDSLKNIVFIIMLIVAYDTCNSKKHWRYFCVALLISLSIFVKQDAVALIPAILIFYVVQKDSFGIKITTLFFFLLSICLVAIFCSNNILYKNLIIGLNQGVSFQYFFRMLKNQLLPHILFLLLLFYFSSVATQKKPRHINGLLAMCATLFTIACLASLKWGSTPVYFTESFQVALIIVAWGFTQKEELKPKEFNLGFALLPIFFSGLIMCESSVGLMKIFNSDSSHSEKFRYEQRVKIGDWIRHNLGRYSQFDIITFDKALINHLAMRCAFPTYETEFPEYMFCGAHPFPRNNRPNTLFEYKQFCQHYEADSIGLYITAQAECDSLFLNISLLEGKAKMVVAGYTLYKK
jgi:hypothetical protein